MAIELNAHGLLEWNDALDYVHPTMVFASDATVYFSVQDSTNQDPIADATNTYWLSLSDAVTVAAFKVDDVSTENPSRSDKLAWADVSRTDNANRAATIAVILDLIQSGDIPGLNASKITGGVFAVGRIPTIAVNRGGTGAQSAQDAREALGIPTFRSGTDDPTVTNPGGITGDIYHRTP